MGHSTLQAEQAATDRGRLNLTHLQQVGRMKRSYLDLFGLPYRRTYNEARSACTIPQSKDE